MNIVFLASGSKGNCTAVQANDVNVLIDVGISMKKINKLLMIELGIDLENIDIILITHSHTDHVQSLKTIMNKYEHIKFVIPQEVRESILSERKIRVDKSRVIDSGDYNKISIREHKINHDVPTFMYRIIDKGDAESYVHISDNGGIYKHSVVNWLKGATWYGVESNHDLTLQIMDEKRNELLKRRVLGYYGHTHNADAMNLAFRIVTPSTKGIIFHHLSEECNSVELASRTHQELMKIWGERTRFKNIKIEYALQHKPVVLNYEEQS